ncbi:MAG: 2-C-methyl-D-erythritol 4-phosphate cytidylyltransferase [Prolixibacteraceae bacterium]|nr:2-C-methyl-D-erythritol 4-phosphate cytidylyltransferase [Prolixibacteraceae bacterium]
MKKFALIVAGGIGNRMKSEVPKQFIGLLGRPILMHTMEAFYNYDSKINIILVLPLGWLSFWNELCLKHQFKLKHQLVTGGEVRFRSVKNGLNSISDNGIVFIHDGVRPLVSTQTISNCYELALNNGNALPVVPVSESVREVNEKNSKAVDRSKYFLVQTPQTFQVSIIKNAYQIATSETFTDDASVLEVSGKTIFITEGNRENIKVTYPEDLLFAEAILSRQ